MTIRTIYIAGDSTASTYLPEEAPMQGWGARLERILPASVRVSNEAVRGRSSKSFIQEGRLASILGRLESGDLLLLQFGHNDNKEDPALRTSPWSDYPHYLRQYIDGARSRGAAPVLISPLARRHVDPSGLLINTHGDYPKSMEALAIREKAAFIDLTGRSSAALRELGESRSREWFVWLKPGEHPNYPEGIEDNTHLSERGADNVAAIVADALVRLHLIPG